MVILLLYRAEPLSRRVRGVCVLRGPQMYFRACVHDFVFHQLCLCLLCSLHLLLLAAPHTHTSAGHNSCASSGALNCLEFLVTDAFLSLVHERQVENFSEIPKADDRGARKLKRRLRRLRRRRRRLKRSLQEKSRRHGKISLDAVAA